VPAATLYSYIYQTEGVDPWTVEIEDLGGSGIANEDICMCEGAHVVVSFSSLFWCQRSCIGFGVLVSSV
jgi:hypothetical protein